MAEPGRSSPAAETLRRDPFRLFFVLGALAGIAGVGQWLPWAAGSVLLMVSRMGMADFALF